MFCVSVLFHVVLYTWCFQVKELPENGVYPVANLWKSFLNIIPRIPLSGGTYDTIQFQYLTDVINYILNNNLAENDMREVTVSIFNYYFCNIGPLLTIGLFYVIGLVMTFIWCCQQITNSKKSDTVYFCSYCRNSKNKKCGTCCRFTYCFFSIILTACCVIMIICVSKVNAAAEGLFPTSKNTIGKMIEIVNGLSGFETVGSYIAEYASKTTSYVNGKYQKEKLLEDALKAQTMYTINHPKLFADYLNDPLSKAIMPIRQNLSDEEAINEIFCSNAAKFVDSISSYYPFTVNLDGKYIKYDETSCLFIESLPNETNVDVEFLLNNLNINRTVTEDYKMSLTNMHGSLGSANCTHFKSILDIKWNTFNLLLSLKEYSAEHSLNCECFQTLKYSQLLQQLSVLNGRYSLSNDISLEEAIDILSNNITHCAEDSAGDPEGDTTDIDNVDNFIQMLNDDYAAMEDGLIRLTKDASTQIETFTKRAKSLSSQLNDAYGFSDDWKAIYQLYGYIVIGVSYAILGLFILLLWATAFCSKFFREDGVLCASLFFHHIFFFVIGLVCLAFAVVTTPALDVYYGVYEQEDMTQFDRLFEAVLEFLDGQMMMEASTSAVLSETPAQLRKIERSNGIANSQGINKNDSLSDVWHLFADTQKEVQMHHLNKTGAEKYVKGVKYAMKEMRKRIVLAIKAMSGDSVASYALQKRRFNPANPSKTASKNSRGYPPNDIVDSYLSGESSIYSFDNHMKLTYSNDVLESGQRSNDSATPEREMTFSSTFDVLDDSSGAHVSSDSVHHLADEFISREDGSASKYDISKEDFRFLRFASIDANALSRYIFRDQDGENAFRQMYSDTTKSLSDLFDAALYDINLVNVDKGTTKLIEDDGDQFYAFIDALTVKGNEEIEKAAQESIKQLNGRDMFNAISAVIDPLFLDLTHSLAAIWMMGVIVLIFLMFNECILMCGRKLWMVPPDPAAERNAKEKFEWRRKKDTTSGLTFFTWAKELCCKSKKNEASASEYEGPTSATRNTHYKGGKGKESADGSKGSEKSSGSSKGSNGTLKRSQQGSSKKHSSSSRKK
ncbi:uncharacterized protein MONOS_2896 [Monocercomonoides exilis]|uniref:uncharacterized protein n=1 Tax=Monocercomonoides exilis TaxID=2049356 RepID=UPI00355A419F|nr:hypothetical protein MONOS_2896 [Monocercomonoides exilis]|eukprot:MONOS_2896.1-p1 / transcript=MONOS_2896.1 / gene=MONOS_2896 / organism=Monocercomonoides_exilis_PA203 / gene_product=unspecified product / transcript_product=unspecified product / location=Mono_scaffold00063:54098-57777(-) / protein_length=1069 / sequence_SO=supercontig / SO=protein_coding / is_pseudo=false